MNRYTFHITLYDILLFAVIIIGLTFSALFWFTKTVNRGANRYLSLALLTIIGWIVRTLFIDIHLENYLKHRDLLTMQTLLAFGPLIYLYVRKTTTQAFASTRKELLHFIPLLLEVVLQIAQYAGHEKVRVDTFGLKLLNTSLQLVTFISVNVYLWLSDKLIIHSYRRFQPVLMDRPLFEFRWLRKLIFVTACLWAVWMLLAGIFYYGYPAPLGDPALCFAIIIVWTAAATYLRSQVAMQDKTEVTRRPQVPAGLRAKADWLKMQVEEKRLYEDPDLNLHSLAKKFNLHTHELSRIINAGLGKTFNELISECRVSDVISKMQDDAYDKMTLLGIAFEAGFNSKSSFNRIFKQLTGKSPVEYKDSLINERPPYNLRRRATLGRLFLKQETTMKWSPVKINHHYMLRNYMKIAWRNFTRNRVSSFINFGGLAAGMAVAMLIGLWIWDELSFDKYHKNYDRIAKVMQHKTFNGTVNTDATIPLPLDLALRKNYGSDFKHIVLTAWNEEHIFNAGERNINFMGNFMSPEAPDMLSLEMKYGTRSGLSDKSSILLSSSAAKELFASSDPVGKTVRLDNKGLLKVTGVYEDLPQNSTFNGLNFIAAIDYYLNAPGNGRSLTDWGDNSLFMYVEMADHTDMAAVSAKIRDIKLNSIPAEDRKFKPVIFLQPMSKWHLYAEFENGVNTGGAILYVRLFTVIGIFILLLACINFMNLSTARSEKRAREVGIRKAVGSLTQQLVKQFYLESLLIAFISFLLALMIVFAALSWFNQVSGKQISIPLSNFYFWLMGIGFVIFTAVIAGSYPALYLSSFNPVKVLKGTFKAGPSAALPRKILVVTQFTVAIILVIGTIVIFKQIQFARDRPIGFNRSGLVDIQVTNDDLHKHFAAVKADLLASGTVIGVAQASTPTTGINNNRGDISWQGKDPSQADFFGSIRVTPEYGKTVGWQFTMGHDFVGNAGDSSSVVINEAAVSFMKLKDPVGQIIQVGQKDLTVIGVVKNMLMGSPYEPVKQAIFYLGRGPFQDVLVKINPDAGSHKALDRIAAVSKTYSPSVPFSYKFADDEYARKFITEERVGNLAAAFAGLAIVISCLGLFGMAMFMAEQRVKEIGVRKVLGASVFGLWRLLSKDFVILVMISFIIAAPLAFIFMHQWLQNYSYHTGIPAWIFLVTAAGAVLLTLATVSYQSVRAALSNPVKSLRTE